MRKNCEADLIEWADKIALFGFAVLSKPNVLF
jgi:hypothetical protein